MSIPAGTEASQLTQAVTKLTAVVEALQKTMTDDYPKRQEIERKYASRAEVNARRKTFAVAMVAAIIASYFATVGTINYCFLGGIPEPGTHGYCHVFPGYDESFDNNRAFVTEFGNLQKQIKQNQKDIAELKKAK